MLGDGSLNGTKKDCFIIWPPFCGKLLHKVCMFAVSEVTACESIGSTQDLWNILPQSIGFSQYLFVVKYE